MILIAYALNMLPDAARYVFMDTGLGHVHYTLIGHALTVFEDGSILIP